MRSRVCIGKEVGKKKKVIRRMMCKMSNKNSGKLHLVKKRMN